MILVSVVSFWTQRNLNFWLPFIRNESGPIEISYWVSFIITFLLNGFILPCNILFEILRLFI